jgi:hypothetical protein
MKPHSESKPGPVFYQKLSGKQDVFFLHDGITNLQENVWWVISKKSANSRTKHRQEHFPAEIINLFNAVKLKAFQL